MKMSYLFSVFLVTGNLPSHPANHISHPAFNALHPGNQRPAPRKQRSTPHKQRPPPPPAYQKNSTGSRSTDLGTKITGRIVFYLSQTS